MALVSNARSLLGIAAFLGVLTLPAALLPPLIVMALQRISIFLKSEADRKVPWDWRSILYQLGVGILCGVFGCACAYVSLSRAQQWLCNTEGRVCYDGQVGLVLIVTIPGAALLTSLLFVLAGWIREASHAASVWAPANSYTGTRTAMNRMRSLLYTAGLLALSAVLIWWGTVALL